MHIRGRVRQLFNRVLQPLTSHSIDADPPVECDDEYWDTGNPATVFKQPPRVPSKISFFTHYVKLTDILSHAQSALYTTAKSRIRTGNIGPEWEQRIAAELDSELNQWLDNLPDHCALFFVISIDMAGLRSVNSALGSEARKPIVLQPVFGLVCHLLSCATRHPSPLYWKDLSGHLRVHRHVLQCCKGMFAYLRRASRPRRPHCHVGTFGKYFQTFKNAQEVLMATLSRSLLSRAPSPA